MARSKVSSSLRTWRSPLSRQGYDRGHASLLAHHPSSVAPTRQVFGQQYVSRTQLPHRPVSDPNFNFAGEGDNILAPRRIMPVHKLARFEATEGDALGQRFFLKELQPVEQEVIVVKHIL